MDEVADERARQGRKFGPVAEEYEQGRPDYPAAAVEAAATGLGLGPDSTVVDIGAGTGKLTRALVARFGRVVAVEPLAPMRQLLTANLPQVEARDGCAERLPLADGEVDAIFVAEAFHWFDTPLALAEAARALKPVKRSGEAGGGIALLWQTFTGRWEPPLPEPARTTIHDAIARGGEPGGPRVERGEWRGAFTGSLFSELHHEQFGHELVRNREGLIAYVLSISSIGGLAAEERQALRNRLQELIPEAVYRHQLRTDLYWARLAAPGWCDHCGGALGEGEHTRCAAARALEPPRFCPRCRRRMKVQVLPAGWTATCVAHGSTASILE